MEALNSWECLISCVMCFSQYLLCMIFKVCSSIVVLLARASLAVLTTPDQYSRVFGLYNAVTSIPFIIGPVIGGHLVEDNSRGFSIVAGLAAACFLINMGVLQKQRKSENIIFQSNTFK